MKVRSHIRTIRRPRQHERIKVILFLSVSLMTFEPNAKAFNPK